MIFIWFRVVTTQDIIESGGIMPTIYYNNKNI